MKSLILFMLFLSGVVHADYTWTIPEDVSLALSIRTPNIDDCPFDYEWSFKTSYPCADVAWLYERERGDYFHGYSLKGDTDVLWGLKCNYQTKVKTAKRINRQSVDIRKEIENGAIGLGFTFVEYSNQKFIAVRTWKIPYGLGEVSFITNFYDVHIWDIETGFELLKVLNLLKLLESSGRAKIPVTYNYYSDGNRKTYQFKIELEIKLRDNDD